MVWFLSYTVRDFPLSDSLKVVGVKTVTGKEEMSTIKDIDNILVTMWKNDTIHYDADSSFEYTRLNHLNFKYQLQIENPSKVERNVFIRLWLGPLFNENGTRLD